MVQRKTFSPEERLLIAEVGLMGLPIVAEPEITDQVPTPIVAGIAFSELASAHNS